ncbi:MAG TPA: TetR family transcriptional regulator [Solirubrobacterales bacterium]|jgi:hypothetical protein|nr:TetR family transcriptional regulator [Solirubrobacterales bacterium]
MATKTKWQQKREASHAALVDSAMHRFHEQGYAATRVEDIVAGTGYSSGAFYFHFNPEERPRRDAAARHGHDRAIRRREGSDPWRRGARVTRASRARPLSVPAPGPLASAASA